MDRIVIKEGSSSSSSESEEESTSGSSDEVSKNEVFLLDFQELPIKKEEEEQEEEVVEFPDVKPEKPKSEESSKKKLKKKAVNKKELDRIAMVLPDVVADRQRERALLKIATKGVVQLFNAVSDRQKELEKQLSNKGNTLDRSSRKRILERLGPSEFKKRLNDMGKIKEETPVDAESPSIMNTSTVPTSPKVQLVVPKEEVESEED
ncbi:unnamed protein product [Enterobius vermicularis]|uniref:RRP15-like protein n=1 Tax=Enterobius vermicularis TaxID=51028 RepID=A0A0N4UVZ3_ENTVE|nr:unnamed protein product [Enterobius vermicularis]